MKVYTKEYGWVRTFNTKRFFVALFLCRGNHKWKTLGDPCYCGSDNCFKCKTCGIESHD